VAKKSSGKYTTNLCGHRVKVARADKNMTQLELATALSMDYKLRFDQTSVGALEKGKRFVKDFELVALAELLGVNPLWLLFGNKIPGKYKN
jgi:transcriptional regulator with XRE-family HTH domain